MHCVRFHTIEHRRALASKMSLQMLRSWLLQKDAYSVELMFLKKQSAIR